MEECSVKFAFDILSGKWKMHIIWELMQQDSIRFNELRRRLKGISNLMLSKSLQEFEACGVVSRMQYDERPVRVEYSLTERGKELRPILDMLEQWSMTMKQFHPENDK